MRISSISNVRGTMSSQHLNKLSSNFKGTLPINGSGSSGVIAETAKTAGEYIAPVAKSAGFLGFNPFIVIGGITLGVFALLGLQKSEEMYRDMTPDEFDREFDRRIKADITYG